MTLDHIPDPEDKENEGLDEISSSLASLKQQILSRWNETSVKTRTVEDWNNNDQKNWRNKWKERN